MNKEKEITLTTVSEKRLTEMIQSMEIFAKNPYGIEINECSSKELLSALVELKVRRSLMSEEPEEM